jgi:cell division protein FtsA
LGSATTRVIVGEFIGGEKTPKIIGAGEYPSQGMRRGYITDQNAATHSIRKAVEQAEKSSGIKIKRGFHIHQWNELKK